MCDAGSGAGRLCFLSLWHNLGVFLFFFAYELGVFWWGALVTYFFFSLSSPSCTLLKVGM